jgi:AraC-like DNA-binding protein
MKASSPPPVSALAAKDWIYIFEKGFLYTCKGLESESVRFPVSVLLSRTGRLFDVEVNGQRESAGAFVIWPDVWRRTHAPNVPLISIGLSVANTWFRTISLLDNPRGFLSFSRASFADCDEAIEAAYEGQLSPRGAKALSDALMKRITADLPKPKPLDERIARVLTLVDDDFRVTMDTLANEVHLSYHRLSHLFSETMGVSLRSYVLARKLDVAFTLASQGMNLTEIAVAAGFADSAHFSRIWARSGGAPPSHFLNNDAIQIRSWFKGQ